MKMLTLAIDTSTSVLSVALVRDEIVLAVVDEVTKHNQSEKLMSRIESMMGECQLKPAHLERIAVAVGPGTYTGIRVGVAAAKSLAYTLNIPVVGVSSLEVMVHAAGVAGLTVAMIDARRETVFAAAYNERNCIIPDGHYTLDDLFAQLEIDKGSISFVGNGAVAHRKRLLVLDNAHIVAESDFNRSKAAIVAKLAANASPQENVHQLVPNYLRKTEAEMNLGV